MLLQVDVDSDGDFDVLVDVDGEYEYEEQVKQSSECFYRTRVRSLAMLVTNSLTQWLTNSVTFSKLMIDVTLACEDAYSKLVEIVTVADVCDENRDGNSLLQIWKLRFGHKA